MCINYIIMDGWTREFNVTFVQVRPNRDGRDSGNKANGTCGQDENSVQHGGTGN